MSLPARRWAGIFVPTVHYCFTVKWKIMSTKFAIIGVVSVLGVGAAMHHARFCPLQKMLSATQHQHSTTAAVKTPAPAAAKLAASVAMK